MLQDHESRIRKLDESDITRNKLKFYNTKEFWAIAAAVITAVIGHFFK